MTNNDYDRPVLSIGAVQRLTHLSARQIRYYEKLGLIKPERSKGNHRLFSRKDVQRLTLIRDLSNEGLNLETIAHVLEQEDMDQMQTSARDRPQARDSGLPRRRADHTPLTSVYPVNNQIDLLRRLLERLDRKAESNEG